MRPYRLQAASGTPGAWRLGRPVTVPQAHYWRRTATELHWGGQVPVPANPSTPVFSITGRAGPSAAGEQWAVNLVEVSTDAQYGQAPLVMQQLTAQLSAGTTAPPPPVVCQVWLAAAQTNLHLLAQTSQGSYDTLDVGGQVVTPGEALRITWWISEAFQDSSGITAVRYRLRGTRYALSVT